MSAKPSACLQRAVGPGPIQPQLPQLQPTVSQSATNLTTVETDASNAANAHAFDESEAVPVCKKHRFDNHVFFPGRLWSL